MYEGWGGDVRLKDIKERGEGRGGGERENDKNKKMSKNTRTLIF